MQSNMTIDLTWSDLRLLLEPCALAPLTSSDESNLKKLWRLFYAKLTVWHLIYMQPKFF